jgi:PAS domain S-box-containing protein
VGSGSSRPQRTFSRLIDAINAPGAVLDLSGNVLSATMQLADMLAIGPERLPGLPFQQFVAPKEHPRYARLLEVTADQPASAAEVVLQRADGEAIYAHLALRRLRPPSPEVITLVAVDLTRLHVVERLEEELQAGVHERMELVHANLALQEDIRRRQLAEAALLVSEAKWRKLFRASPVVVVLTSVAEGTILDGGMVRSPTWSTGS